MNSQIKSYQQLSAISRNIQTFASMMSLLEWDQETYMPREGGSFRGEQMKVLAGYVHQAQTGKKFAGALAKLVDLNTGKITASSLSDQQRSALKRWYRDYKQEIALPTKFVEEFTKLASQSQLVWRKAKTEDAFYSFAPYLDKLLQMVRKKADLLGYKEHPYDALLELYEPGISTKEVSALFKPLKARVVELLKKIARSKQPENHFLFGKFDQKKQLEFGRLLLDAMGFDKNRGRLDLSTHPFSCALHPSDCRITTRIHQTSLFSNIAAVLHEGGHSLYEMGLPADQYGTPLGQPVSLGIHESQSRWWETRMGLSKPFWHHFLPILKTYFKGKLDDISLNEFYRGINKVQPSLIRVEADEVTYSLHVILRFELEKSLVEGTLRIRDIPEAWNEKMKELLGLAPSNNAEGCLQDVHWSFGAFGYFPTYALGNIYASHLFNAFEKKHQDWKKRVSTGELGFIKEWLVRSVHQHGRRYTSQELLKKATMAPVTEKAYIAYLNDKYIDIYNLTR